MKTNRMMLLAACLSTIMILSSCRIETAKDLGATKTEKIEVKPFDEIELTGDADVIYHVSDTISVSITAPEKLMDSYEIGNDGKRLCIRKKDRLSDGKIVLNVGNFSRKGGVTVHVYGPHVTAIRVVGSGDVTCSDSIQAEKVVCCVTGSGDIDCAAVKTDTLSLEVTGSGDIEIKGAEAASSTMLVTGSGDIKVHLNNGQTASAIVTGSGEITLSGTVGQFNQQVSGSGDINAKNLTITKK